MLDMWKLQEAEDYNANIIRQPYQILFAHNEHMYRVSHTLAPQLSAKCILGSLFFITYFIRGSSALKGFVFEAGCGRFAVNIQGRSQCNSMFI